MVPSTAPSLVPSLTDSSLLSRKRSANSAFSSVSSDDQTNNTNHHNIPQLTNSGSLLRVSSNSDRPRVLPLKLVQPAEAPAPQLPQPATFPFTLPLSHSLSRGTSSSTPSIVFPSSSPEDPQSLSQVSQSSQQFSNAAALLASQIYFNSMRNPGISHFPPQQPQFPPMNAIPLFTGPPAELSSGGAANLLWPPQPIGLSSPTATASPGKLLLHVSKRPMAIFPVELQFQYTVSKKDADRLSSPERLRLVPTRLRIMGNSQTGPFFVVAKDLCMLVHVRKGNVAKTVAHFTDNEKFRMPVVCHRSNGISSTQILTVLSEAGADRLVSSSRSPLAPVVRDFLQSRLSFLRSSLFDPIDRVNAHGFVLKVATPQALQRPDSPLMEPFNPEEAAEQAKLQKGGPTVKTENLKALENQQASIAQMPNSPNPTLSTLSPAALYSQASELVSALQAQQAAHQRQQAMLSVLTESIKANQGLSAPQLTQSIINAFNQATAASGDSGAAMAGAAAVHSATR